MTDDWLPLLRQAVADSGNGGVTRIARRLGVTRAYVSQVINGLRPAPQRFIDRVHVLFSAHACPHLGADLTAEQCRQYAARPYAAITAPDVEHWRACRRCPRNPLRPETQK